MSALPFSTSPNSFNHLYYSIAIPYSLTGAQTPGSASNGIQIGKSRAQRDVLHLRESGEPVLLRGPDSNTK